MKLKTLLMGAIACTAHGTRSYGRARLGRRGQNHLLAGPIDPEPVLVRRDKRHRSAASLVIEPLGRYDENGDLVPFLAEEIPTVENGGVSADLTTDHLETQIWSALVRWIAGYVSRCQIHRRLLHEPRRRLCAVGQVRRRFIRRRR